MTQPKYHLPPSAYRFTWLQRKISQLHCLLFGHQWNLGTHRYGYAPHCRTCNREMRRKDFQPTTPLASRLAVSLVVLFWLAAIVVAIVWTVTN